MKYKIQTLQEGKKPNDDMCRAVAAMFPTFVDETNVALTRHEEPGSFISQSKMADYTVDGETSTIASEVRSMAMAAQRYRNKHYQTRQHRFGRDTVMVNADAGAVEDDDGADEVEEDDEDDAALIGYDSDGEGESEGEAEEETEME